MVTVVCDYFIIFPHLSAHTRFQVSLLSNLTFSNVGWVIHWIWMGRLVLCQKDLLIFFLFPSSSVKYPRIPSRASQGLRMDNTMKRANCAMDGDLGIHVPSSGVIHVPLHRIMIPLKLHLYSLRFYSAVSPDRRKRQWVHVFLFIYFFWFVHILICLWSEGNDV